MITETFRDLPPRVKAQRKLNENVLKFETYQKLSMGLNLPENYRNLIEKASEKYYRENPDATRIPREIMTGLLVGN